MPPPVAHGKSRSKTPGTFCSCVTGFFEELGPPYMWTVMLSAVEWEHLTDNQKELHRTMRESWLSIYNKASHTVLQHWLWRFLKSPATPVALSLLRLLLSTPTGVTKTSTTNTTLSPPSFKTTT